MKINFLEKYGYEKKENDIYKVFRRDGTIIAINKEKKEIDINSTVLSVKEMKAIYYECLQLGLYTSKKVKEDEIN